MAVGDIVSGGFDLSGVSGTFGNSLSVAWVVLQIIFGIGLLLTIFFVIKWYLSYNVLAVVSEKRGTTVYNYPAKAKLFYDKKDKNKVVQRVKIFGQKRPLLFPTFLRDESGQFLLKDRLNKKGEVISNVTMSPKIKNYENIFGVTKKGKLSFNIFKEGDEFTIVPWYNEDIREYLRVSKPTREQWANNLLREGLEELFPRDQGFFEKYGSLVMMGGAFIVIAIIFIMLFNKFDQLASLSGALNHYADSLSQMASAVRETNVQNLGGG